ncbi:oligomeric complex COG6 [Epithele typhae]|uniref:oligomeric complex COG6 n=1 Tax=Epithele typhae TaxID=378194 RepID=UPI002007A9CF|nr:oligomeric complex COG6 [Epithele typhae]KAH9945786.1 oligomeric complex COG6 [Epithele typhae]
MTAISPTLSPPVSRVASLSAPQAQNPISLRLYKVLGAHFDDDATREALDTLAELYAPAPASAAASSSGAIDGHPRGGKGKRLSLDGDGYGDGDEERERTLSGAAGKPNGLVARATLEETLPGDIAARARKNLRRDVENKLAESSRQFLQAFSEVDKQLDTLQEHLGLMRVRCDEAQTQLHETNEACKSLLDRAGSLREERQGVAVRQSIISLFLSRFTLSPDEKAALSSRDVPIGPRFFAAMDKAAAVRADCRVLMTGDQEGDARAGLDILATTAAQLETAYERLCRYCAGEFRAMGKDASLDVPPALQEAVKRLRERPEVLQESLTYLSQTRQATLLSSFMDALTRGGPGGLPRPIELHAHDPLRYVGDMLAWVHQAIAAEREFLEALFGVRATQRMVGAVRERDEGSADEAAMSALLDGAVAGLCGPLRARVRQTASVQESSITEYKIANLLGFYLLTMQRTIGKEALVSKTLEELTDLAYSVFYGAVETQGRSLLRVPLDLDDAGVAPPLAIMDHTQVLREMMVVYESSLLGDEKEEELQAGFRDILDKMVDPAMEMCLTGAEDKKKQRPNWDKAVFVLNTLGYLQSVLEPFAFTVEKRGVVQGLVDAKVLQLIEEHYRDVVVDAGLAEVADALDSRKPQEPLSHIEAAEPAALQAALHRFSEWLSGAAVVHSPRLASLTVQAAGARVHQAALGRLASTYGRICEAVRAAENKYEAGATLLGSERPFGQVRLLGQILGLHTEEER